MVTAEIRHAVEAVASCRSRHGISRNLLFQLAAGYLLRLLGQLLTGFVMRRENK